MRKWKKVDLFLLSICRKELSLPQESIVYRCSPYPRRKKDKSKEKASPGDLSSLDVKDFLDWASPGDLSSLYVKDFLDWASPGDLNSLDDFLDLWDRHSLKMSMISLTHHQQGSELWSLKFHKRSGSETCASDYHTHTRRVMSYILVVLTCSHAYKLNNY